MGVLIGFFKWVGDALSSVLSFLLTLPGLIVTLCASFGAICSEVWSYLNELCADTSLTSSLSNAISDFSTTLTGSHGAGGSLFDCLSWGGALDVAFDVLGSITLLYVGFWGAMILSLLFSVLALCVAALSFRLVAKAINLIQPFVRV